MRKLLISILIMGASFIPCAAHAQARAQAQPEDAATSAKIDRIFLSWNKPGVPGAAVVVVRDGMPSILRCYGEADLERASAIGPQTLFNIASLAKPFTAFAVLMLQEQGKLSLDDDVRRHVPEFPDFGKPITIRQLLNHTGGLRDWGGLHRMSGGGMEDVITTSLVLKLILGQRELNFAPGTEYAYCNAGYNLLAEIAARASGRSFKEYLRQVVFEPLKMGRAFVRDQPGELPPGTARSYRRTRDAGYAPVQDNEAAPGPGSLYLSAEDMGRWLSAWLERSLGSPRVWAQMSETGRTSDGRAIPYAGGLIPDRYKGLPILSHSGGWAGFRAEMVAFPEQRLAVSVLSNLSMIDATMISRRIAEIFLEGQFPPAPAPSAPVPVDGAALDAAIGRYWLRGEQTIVVTRKDDRLVAQFSGDMPRELAAESADTFLSPFIGAKLLFHRDGTDKARKLTFFQGAAALPAERIPDDPWSPADAGEFCGRYKSDELGAVIEVKMGVKGLYLPYPKVGDLTLVPMARDRFAGKDASVKIVFVRDGGGKVRELRFSLLDAWNVRFVRITNP